MGDKSYCTIEVEGRSAKRTSVKPHQNFPLKNVVEKLCMVDFEIERWSSHVSLVKRPKMLLLYHHCIPGYGL